VIRAFVTSPRFLPVLMMVLQTGSAIRYAIARQPGPVVYWVSAVGITYAVTFMRMGGK
jgi:hypothetical protein